MAGDWRISADERSRYETYFQQCGPIQGYLSGEQARDFFVKSTLPGDILRKIWDLADVTADGRLDKREFAIACCLISSQVQKKGSLPSALPSSLLSDSSTTTNGVPSMPTLSNAVTPPGQTLTSGQPVGHNLKTTGSVNIPSTLLTPIIRAKYLEQFHSLVDVTKTNGFMTGLQAKNILQQTGLSHILLHQIWNLADNDKDGRLTPDEFVVAMHCCDIARTGQTLPTHLPDEWSHTNIMQGERTSSLRKSNDIQAFANLNQQLKETIHITNTIENKTTNPSAELSEAEQKSLMVTYEEKRLRNYEDGNKELERRRQLLREQEEREQKERDERERKREFELQKQKDEQDRKKQMEIDRQLEKQRQIEQQRDEERKKLYEQREAARKELERKNRLEWERQRMQELSTQKLRLLDQINDLKSREKGHELELQSMDDTTQTCQTKIDLISTNIHTMDQSIADIQQNIMTEKNLLENVEQQKKDLNIQLHDLQAERESLDSSLNHLNLSKEFNTGNRESDQMKLLQTQIENMKQESTEVDEQMITMTEQCKEYQNQMEQLHLQLSQLEQEAKDKKPPSKVTSPTSSPATFANFDQFNANNSSNNLNDQLADEISSLPVAPTATSPLPSVDVDPFQTVDPFASQSDIGSTTANNDWFQPSNNDNTTTTSDPFFPKTETKLYPSLPGAEPTVDPFLPTTGTTVDPFAPTAGTTADPFAPTAGTTADPFFPTTGTPVDLFASTAVDPFLSKTEATIDPFAATTDVAVDPFRTTTEATPDPFLPTTGTTVDPFLPTTKATVDPFLPTTEPAVDPFVPTTGTPVDPFVPKIGPLENLPVVASPKTKKAAPKANTNLKDASKQTPAADPWGGSTTTTTNNGNGWAAFNNPSSTSAEPPTATIPADKSSTVTVQYRVLYDYTPEHPDEMGISSGDIITVDPSKQQDEHWLFGQIGDDKQGIFPVAYTELITSTPSNDDKSNAVDTTSQLSSGSWVMTVAECQGKTVDKHLSFQKGELILVREQKDTTWYSGQLDDKVGWFPRSYVQPATEVEIQNKTNSAKNTPTSEKPLNLPISSNTGPSNDADNAEIYEAIYSYEAADQSDLSFNVGDHIIVVHCDGDWWTGKIGDRVGTFPNNYVQKIENPVQETAIAIAPFQTTEEGQLSFEQNQIIYITKKDENGWYEGETQLPGQPIQVGWFPANRVQIQTAVLPTSQSTISDQKISELPRCIAIFPYEAQQDDELSFPADAVLEILDQAGSNGWFKARLGDQMGLIPSTYVQSVDAPTQSSSTPCHLSANIIPCTPITANSFQQSFVDDSTLLTLTSTDDSASFITETSSPQLLTNSARISAIRELIETEQRYVNDLRTVANDFIKPLSNGRVLSDYEIEQLFSNWFSLIACNTVFLSTLQEQVQFKEPTLASDNDVPIQIPRSASISDIATAAQAPAKDDSDNLHNSFIPQVSYSTSTLHSKHPTGTYRRHHRRRSPSGNTLRTKKLMSIERLDDNIVPQTSQPPSTMTIDDSTRIGEILCSYLPFMADAYFQYCNCRSQANKYLQSKADLNDQFRIYLKIFQDKTGGLSLNGFLTKPIQRVTRYPLLIEKILKHTLNDHPDYQSIQQAFERARQLNERINKQICEQENSLRLDWLQQHFIFGNDGNCSDGYLLDELLTFNSITKFHIQRQLLLHGLIMKVPSGKEILAFLFNDFLLFSTMKTSSSNWQSQLFEPKSTLQLKLYRLPLFLTDILTAIETSSDEFTFSIATKIYEKPLVLKTQQTNVRTLWVRAINNAVEECQATEKSILADKGLFTVIDNKCDSASAVARLLLTVQEAHDLMPATATLKRHRNVNPYCEITVGSLTLKTPLISQTDKPKWNAPMQFLLHNLAEDIIHINIFDNEHFSPNENLGYISVHLTDILPCPLETFLADPSQSFTQTVYLNNGSSIDIQCIVQFIVPYE